ncbi:profilin [Aspergillus minisclerotigenes]|uniref:Profilin n=1 Tax=Aspergillus minisclerotigenes TaxID=656917 RepID=A0A5N6JM81_9EURO|nr:profilin [Aspergillus minisclerotigenes]
MSWQDYVDHQLIRQGLAHAAFIGEDLAVWASSEGFNLSEAERRAMFDAFGNPDHVYESGLYLTGRHFHPVAADDRIIKVTQGRNGAMLVRMKSFIIVGEYGDLAPAQGQHFINKVADQLTASGY